MQQMVTYTYLPINYLVAITNRSPTLPIYRDQSVWIASKYWERAPIEWKRTFSINVSNHTLNAVENNIISYHSTHTINTYIWGADLRQDCSETKLRKFFTGSYWRYLAFKKEQLVGLLVKMIRLSNFLLDYRLDYRHITFFVIIFM